MTRPLPPPSAWRPARLLSIHDAPQAIDQCVAEETPVAFHYNGMPHAVMMATPQDLADFALGFSWTEGIVASPKAIRGVDIQPRDDGSIDITLRIDGPSFARLLSTGRRAMTGRSSCGVCGTEHIDDVTRVLPPVPRGTPVAMSAIGRALEALETRQPLNADVHMVHAAAWADLHGTVTLAREDIGRHNALDKLIGARMAAGAETDGFAIITSRCSFEMVQKAVAAGISVLVALSAPTARALDVAERAGLTLVARARRDRQMVFTHPWRIEAT
ncbi:formate dehydrogenase accessory protein FdhD [Ameyamaea chiangmaiensis NBRC 103196]|uniref:Sulfur carrier protein FdhD n=1 Tax=Ameyamaea chiangmaiensis TaxID=442969 RepID=A0A850PG30_9PROT|nr:formate dehydrogenase accessory sulfurtransferase FdhD [Ameyamaea chiangmaiensis]MBS4074312.1 formate dehydrogenase accessory sulfurtransferase FdhD [Ameyamaea chiangmaiensis]NVN41176.1 formate dehydrogenase accessory sulfurtransferase FdhD [Ameyamaea chiangmaiensis]GBQ71609.1 formate dehydrogenase accessory protein FdhD [Ameyamaea chiangmaiensis NBRC 103196]